MSIGVRILSNNLSGQTANVTFYPFSGGNINIGTVTIPFNYLSPNPYGTYSIYVPLYDYTYTLTVYEQNPSNTQSYTWVSTPPLNEIWVRAVLNYNDLTAEIFQFFDLPTSEWNYDTIYPITESGYTHFFYNVSNNDHRYVIFTDSFGNIIGEYSGITSNYDREALDGHYNAFIDYDNRVMAYSNGQTYNEFTWDSDKSFEWFANTYSGYWNYTTKNGSMIVRLYDNVTYEYLWYLIRPTDFELIDVLPNDNSFIDFYVNNYSDFIQKITKDSGSTYTDITILEDISGSTIDVTILSADTYNYNYVYFYGDNKIGTVLFNNGDSNIDWFIHTYNGNTQITVLDSHVRGSDYFSFTSPSVGKNDYNQITPGDNFYVIFYNSNFNYDTNRGYEVNYLEIMSLFSGDSNFNITTFQDSGSYDKSFEFNFTCSHDLVTICSTGDNITTIYTLTNQGANLIPTQQYNDFAYFNTYRFANRFVLMNRDGLVPNDANIYLVEGNNLLDTLYLIPANGYFNTDTSWGIFMIFDYEQNNYYVNNTVDHFVQTSPFTDNYYSPYVYWGLGYQTQTFAKINQNNGQISLFSHNLQQGPFTLPVNGGSFNISIGRDRFLYVYQQPTWLGNYVINLYDFEFNLLNSIETEYTNVWNTRAAKDRYFVEFQNNETNNFTLTLISDNTSQSVEISNYNYDRTINDFIYWYD